MDTLKLNSKIRDIFGKKNKGLREKGFIPATVYGKNVGPFSITIEGKELNMVYKQAGDNTVVELVIEDNGKENTFHTLIQDIVRTPVGGEIMHVDFHAVSLTEKVKAYIEIETVGENDLLKSGGNVVMAMTEIEVEALPTNLPHKILVDISSIKSFGESIYVKDLKVDKEVKILAEENNPVVTLAEQENVEEELKAMETETPVEAVPSEGEEKKEEEEEKKEEEVKVE